MTLVLNWASLGPSEYAPSGSLLDLVNLVPIWASPSPGAFVPHLDLIAVDSSLASPGTGDSDPICESPRPVDSGPHLGIIGTGDSVPHLSLTWT